MQPAPMICEVNLDLAVAAKLKQIGCVTMRVCRNALEKTVPHRAALGLGRRIHRRTSSITTPTQFSHLLTYAAGTDDM
jgi:hypothetical protein